MPAGPKQKSAVDSIPVLYCSWMLTGLRIDRGESGRSANPVRFGLGQLSGLRRSTERATDEWEIVVTFQFKLQPISVEHGCY